MITIQQLVGEKGPTKAAAVTLDSTPIEVEHGLGVVPAAVLFCQIKAGAAVAATPSYDRAASTNKVMKLATNSATPSDWVCIPIGGQF